MIKYSITRIPPYLRTSLEHVWLISGTRDGKIAEINLTNSEKENKSTIKEAKRAIKAALNRKQPVYNFAKMGGDNG